MGSITSLFKGISKARYDELVAEASEGEMIFLREVATDEVGRHHDPNVRAWVEGEPQRKEAEKRAKAREMAQNAALQCVETFLLETLPVVAERMPDGEEVRVTISMATGSWNGGHLAVTTKGVALVEDDNIPF
jgi:hypothetical protein